MRQRRIGNTGPLHRHSRHCRRHGMGLIGGNETMRGIEGEEIACHIGRNPLV